MRKVLLAVSLGVLGSSLMGCVPPPPPLQMESCGLPTLGEPAGSGIYSTVYHCNLTRNRVFVKGMADRNGHFTANLEYKKGDLIEICQVITVSGQSSDYTIGYDFKGIGFSVEPVRITGYQGQSMKIIRSGEAPSYGNTSDGTLRNINKSETIYVCNVTEA